MELARGCSAGFTIKLGASDAHRSSPLALGGGDCRTGSHAVFEHALAPILLRLEDLLTAIRFVILLNLGPDIHQRPGPAEDQSEVGQRVPDPQTKPGESPRCHRTDNVWRQRVCRPTRRRCSWDRPGGYVPCRVQPRGGVVRDVGVEVPALRPLSVRLVGRCEPGQARLLRRCAPRPFLLRSPRRPSLAFLVDSPGTELTIRVIPRHGGPILDARAAVRPPRSAGKQGSLSSSPDSKRGLVPSVGLEPTTF